MTRTDKLRTLNNLCEKLGINRFTLDDADDLVRLCDVYAAYVMTLKALESKEGE